MNSCSFFVSRVDGGASTKPNGRFMISSLSLSRATRQQWMIFLPCSAIFLACFSPSYSYSYAGQAVIFFSSISLWSLSSIYIRIISTTNIAYCYCHFLYTANGRLLPLSRLTYIQPRALIYCHIIYKADLLLGYTMV